VSIHGYDLRRLDALRRELRSAGDTLAALRSDDPLATSAMGAIEAARRALEHRWLPDLAEVIGSDPLGRPARWGAPHATSWSSGGGWDWFRDRGADEASVDHERWAVTFDELAERRMHVQEQLVWDPENAALHLQLAVVDVLIAERSQEYAALGAEHGSSWPYALHDATPMAAALVLQHLDLSDGSLARMCDRLLRRWHEGGEHGERFDDWYLGGDNTADIVFRILVERPAAATAFLQRVSPAELFLSAQHDDVVADLLVVGTSPDHVDEATAGQVLQPLLVWLQDHPLPGARDGLTRSAPAVIATAVTPWLADLGPRAEMWGWRYEEGDRALRWLLDDPGALAAITASVGVWQVRLHDTPLLGADGRIDDRVLRDLAGTLAQVQIALRDQEVATAAADALVAQLTVNTAGLAIGAAIPGGGVAVAADVGVGVLTPLAMRALDRWGIAPSVEHASEIAQGTFGDRAIDTAVIAVTGIVGLAIDRGDLPADALDLLDLDALTGACAPREVSDRLHGFVAELEPLTDAATHHALLTVVYAFANPLSDAQLCN